MLFVVSHYFSIYVPLLKSLMLCFFMLNCFVSLEPVVVLNMQSIDPEKKYALLQCAGCLLDTSVRDGLNLVNIF